MSYLGIGHGIIITFNGSLLLYSAYDCCCQCSSCPVQSNPPRSHLVSSSLTFFPSHPQHPQPSLFILPTHSHPLLLISILHLIVSVTFPSRNWGVLVEARVTCLLPSSPPSTTPTFHPSHSLSFHFYSSWFST